MYENITEYRKCRRKETEKNFVQNQFILTCKLLWYTKWENACVKKMRIPPGEERCNPVTLSPFLPWEERIPPCTPALCLSLLSSFCTNELDNIIHRWFTVFAQSGMNVCGDHSCRTIQNKTFKESKETTETTKTHSDLSPFDDNKQQQQQNRKQCLKTLKQTNKKSSEKEATNVEIPLSNKESPIFSIPLFTCLLLLSRLTCLPTRWNIFLR